MIGKGKWSDYVLQEDGERKNAAYLGVITPEKALLYLQNLPCASANDAPFLPTGFLRSEAIHHWISIPFFIIYFTILFGNGTLLFLI